MFNKFNRFYEKLTPATRKIITNTTWLYFDRIFGKGLALIISILVARYLGPTKLGSLSFALAIASLVGIVAKLGLDQLIVRDIVKEPENKDEILGTTFILKVFGGFISLFLTVGVVFLLRPQDRLTLWLAGIIAGGSIFLAFDVIEFWFESQVESKYTVIAKRGAYILTSLITILLVQFEASLLPFAGIRTLEAILIGVGLVSMFQTRHSLKAWRWNFKRGIALLKESWPLIFTSLAITIYMRVDTIMLWEITGDDSVGVYSAAVKISEAWYFIATSLVASVFPSIVKAKEVNEKLYYKKLQQLFNLMALIGYVIAIPMTFFSTPLVLLLYGPNYLDSGNILAVHIWAALFAFMGVVQIPWNITEGLTKLYLARTLVGMLSNVVLNIFLIPLYQGLGAAIATVISYAVSGFFANLFDPRTRKIFKLQAKSLIFLK
ncbi:MAG: flippase [Okeania sp. SIO3I5]|uniref:flippase n=1 Tax=Okeania sp. SIO3I5 TaxID=2607805 RepID=UPI0013B7956D|nr:flippase [Okeania sp. SIO3I5]NEQ38362.1 flippase [Okeania sp. SIO3I5]